MPSFGIGSAHAQKRPPPPLKPHNARPTRDRACTARRPANSRYVCSSATKSLRIHAAQLSLDKILTSFTTA